jgi:hypothetical protein
MRRQKPKALSIKDAVYLVMEEAYMKASASNTLPANARQIMYAARPLVLTLTDGKCWKDSSYFTQHLLPNFMEFDPRAASWNVVFDARGHFQESHRHSARTDLGTLEVQRYIGRWIDRIDQSIELGVAIDDLMTAATSGPTNRYRWVLFIEKEGFTPLPEEEAIAERFDIGIMSTKGMSTTASRLVIEELSWEGVTIPVARDFDKAGFSIVHTMRTDTHRYQLGSRLRVVDLGLRLTDAREMGLESEHVDYKDTISPRYKLRESGATEEECCFLVQPAYGGGWTGRRVELNAMTSAEFINWLEQKLIEAGVEKVVPDGEVLAAAYRRAMRVARISKAIEAAMADHQEEEITVPENLAERIRDRITGTMLPWDHALCDLVTKEAS